MCLKSIFKFDTQFDRAQMLPSGEHIKYRIIGAQIMAEPETSCQGLDNRWATRKYTGPFSVRPPCVDRLLYYILRSRAHPQLEIRNDGHLGCWSKRVTRIKFDS